MFVDYKHITIKQTQGHSICNVFPPVTMVLVWCLFMRDGTNNDINVMI